MQFLVVSGQLAARGSVFRFSTSIIMMVNLYVSLCLLSLQYCLKLRSIRYYVMGDSNYIQYRQQDENRFQFIPHFMRNNDEFVYASLLNYLMP